MSSEDSDTGPRKKKPRRLEDSPASTSSGGSPIIGSSSRLRASRRGQLQNNPIDSSGSDSGSDCDSPIIVRSQRKRVARVSSDSESDSSGSTPIRRNRGPRRLSSSFENESDAGFEGSSQWETDTSDHEKESAAQANVSKTTPDTANESDASDGQSEKCPICLISFKKQEIGTPESCDHMFCLECLQEWSKNMNTCPVDRQEYKLILVRKNLNEKVARQIPVEKPPVQQEVDIVEDPTFCEVCGSCDNEDRLLLCDGCDLGFHLYCLNPPLEFVPAGSWYCYDCSNDPFFDPNEDHELDFQEVDMLLRDAESSIQRFLNQRRRNHSTR